LTVVEFAYLSIKGLFVRVLAVVLVYLLEWAIALRGMNEFLDLARGPRSLNV
jgi:hypothetical protein